MMPHVVSVRVRSDGRTRVRLWIPLLPVFLVLLPLEVLALVVLVIACAVSRVNPLRAVGTGGRILLATKGTRIEIEQRHTAVLVQIR